MYAPRFWPTFQAIGRTLVCNRSEILQQGVRAYNHPNNFGNNPYAGYSDQHSRQKIHQSVSKTNHGSYMKIVSRTLSSGTVHFLREFSNCENEHAHSVLQSIPAYSATIINAKNICLTSNTEFSGQICPSTNWFSVQLEEIVQAFIDISVHLSQFPNELESKSCSNLCQTLCQRMSVLSDGQLMKILSALTHWTPIHSTNSHFVKLLNAIETNCSTRIRHWSTAQALLVADYWYTLELPKSSLYYMRLLQYLWPNVGSLSSSQLVQYMFYINLSRESIGAKQLHVLENKILEIIEKISVEELGIIAMGLFKTESSIKSEDLLNNIVKVVLENKDIVSNNSLGSILKLLRISFPSHAIEQCYNILDALNSSLDKFNTPALLQIILLGNNLLVYHEEVVCKIALKFGKELSSIRLKEIERLTYALMLYKCIPSYCPHIYQLIIEELRKPERIIEINHFPHCFLSCVSYLVAAGWFPVDLVSAVLQPSMIQLIQSSAYTEIGREMSELNWSLRIEGPPNYLGYQLESHFSEYLTKKYLGRIPSLDTLKLTHQERFLLDVNKKLCTILATASSAPAIILPHFRNPDLVFCTDNYGDPVDIPQEFLNQPPEMLKLPMFVEYGITWNAVIVGGRNSFIRPNCSLRGNLEMKKRQLQKLGYKVSVVNHYHYLKKSTKYRLRALNIILCETSSLNMEGREGAELTVLSPSLMDDPVRKVEDI